MTVTPLHQEGFSAIISPLLLSPGPLFVTKTSSPSYYSPSLLPNSGSFSSPYYYSPPPPKSGHSPYRESRKAPHHLPQLRPSFLVNRSTLHLGEESYQKDHASTCLLEHRARKPPNNPSHTRRQGGGGIEVLTSTPQCQSRHMPLRGGT